MIPWSGMRLVERFNMSFDPDIDCSATEEVVCPHCAYQYKDSWEIFKNSDYDEVRVNCENCGLDFEVHQNFIVTYTSNKLENEV